MSATETLNIWGMPGCLLPNGKDLCHACCNIKGVEDKEYGENGFIKGIGVPCPILRVLNNRGQGCGVHPFSPTPCQNYHCSQETPAIKTMLIDNTYSEGKVTLAEAEEAYNRKVS